MINRRRIMADHDDIIMTSETNSEVLAICHAQGWAANPDYMTKREARKVTDISTVFRNNKDITQFEELSFFTRLSQLALYSFKDASNLSTIELPDNISVINNQSFQGTSITSIYIPSKVKQIGFALFDGTELSSITVSPDNVYFDSRNNCNAIIDSKTNVLRYGCKNTVIPSSVTSIYSYAFSIKGLQTITIPNSVTSINGGFYNCSDLVTIEIPNSVTILDGGAFKNCGKLRTITLPSTITKIGDFCFYFNGNLEGSLSFPSVTSVGSQAFVRCYKISHIHFGDKLQSIGYAAFNSMTGLQDIIIDATTPPTLNNANAFDSTNGCPIYVPDNSVDTYKGATNWSTYASRIKGISELPE